MVVKNLGIVLGIVGLVWVGCGGDGPDLTDTVTVGNGGAGGKGSGSGESSSSSSGSSGNPMGVYDPNGNGPYAILELSDAQYTNPATGNKVPMRAFYPAGGPTAGPYPVVVVAHGFQLPASQYTNYIMRLATFGYVAITADFPASFVGMDNTKNAKDLISAMEWANTKSELEADTSKVGMTGHSLGGKLALLAATMDSRIKASIVLDPVDGGGGPIGGCNPPTCVDVSKLMPTLNIPTGFLGETLDSSGGIQPCAPAAENYTTFFADANAPSLSVTVKGANHMSFLDNAASCGTTCSFCKPATADNATVAGLSRAYVTAFYERYLRGNTAYDTYLTGVEAQMRYVDAGLVTIESK
jgi:predicted dienelactone hydrolase